MSASDEDDQPLDPALERVRRKMIRLLVVSFGIMTVGLMAVLGTIVYRLGERADQNFGGTIELPAGAAISQTSLDGERALLTITLAGGGRELWLVDLRDGQRLGKLDVK